jgi:hypothetical protein
MRIAGSLLGLHLAPREKCIKIFDLKSSGKRPLGKARRRFEDNVKMELKEIGWGSGEWTSLTHDRDQWRTLLNTVMKLRVS